MLVAKVQLYWSGIDCEPFWRHDVLHGHQQRLLCASFVDARLVGYDLQPTYCYKGITDGRHAVSETTFLLCP